MRASEEEASAAVADDIEREFPTNERGDAIDAEGFFACLFETVDVWTVSAEAAEYVGFLRSLYLRITVDTPPPAPLPPPAAA